MNHQTPEAIHIDANTVSLPIHRTPLRVLLDLDTFERIQRWDQFDLTRLRIGRVYGTFGHARVAVRPEFFDIVNARDVALLDLVARPRTGNRAIHIDPANLLDLRMSNLQVIKREAAGATA